MNTHVENTNGQKSIEALVKATIAKELNVSVETIASKDRLEDIGLGSLEFIELLMALETEFDIHIVEEDAKNIGTVQQIIDYIQQHQKQ